MLALFPGFHETDVQYVHMQRARILYTQAIWITDENEKKHLSGLYECLYACSVHLCLD